MIREIQEGTSGTLYRYSISADTWIRLANNAPAGFGSGGGLAYPGVGGDIFYGLRGDGQTNFFAKVPPEVSSLAQSRLDGTSVAVGATLSDTNSIRFSVRASDSNDTFRIQIELRLATRPSRARSTR